MDQKIKRIAIGSDHYGYKMKNEIKDYLISLGYLVDDFGVNDENPVMYPEIAINVCKEIQKGKYDRAILVCGTGAGMSIVANKIKGVRAVCIHDAYTAERARASNDAQVATLGSLVIGINSAKKNIDIWLANEFQGGRSKPKIDMIKALDGSES